LPVARVRAHKGRLTAMDGCGLRLVTGSGSGALRCWDVLELRRAALEQVRRAGRLRTRADVGGKWRMLRRLPAA
jgi:hypothetical protein